MTLTTVSTNVLCCDTHGIMAVHAIKIHHCKFSKTAILVSRLMGLQYLPKASEGYRGIPVTTESYYTEAWVKYRSMCADTLSLTPNPKPSFWYPLVAFGSLK